MASSIEGVPDWVSTLRDGAEPGHKALPLQWLDGKASRARGGEMLETWDEIPFGEDFKAICRRRIARSVPVASGPPRRARLAERQEPLTLLFDPEAPEGLVAALGDKMPSLLWVPLGRTPASLREALGPYLASALGSVHGFSRVERIFKGTSDELGLDSIDHLAQAIAVFEGWIDTPFWGNAKDDDPWPLDPSSLSMIHLRVLLDESRRQTPSRFLAYGFRTLWSRSVLRVEQHAWNGFVFELRYEPSRHPDLARALRTSVPNVLPDDIPVDLLASILRGPILTRDFVDEAIGREGAVPYLALAKCALEPGETTALALLESMQGGEHAMAALELASAYGYRGLLHEVLATTEDASLRGQLEGLLAPKPPTQAAEDEDEDLDGAEEDDDFDEDEDDDFDEDEDDDFEDEDEDEEEEEP
ncbi:hypothetical protein [Polyangium aurulentum]|uniref:hypothetical protein n=1 Tax=Polyangium aurulentum TaxID=2567896 RepID=UPI0010ADFB09|nr:hypothetical protein [Polyangium aurulentum]UQA57300.1 hypothetical protein E8A73_039380 [Polyangium aurulentum]